jgi:hypothetical protein
MHLGAGWLTDVFLVRTSRFPSLFLGSCFGSFFGLLLCYLN